MNNTTNSNFWVSFDTGIEQTAAYRIKLNSLTSSQNSNFYLQLGEISKIPPFPSYEDIKINNMPNLAGNWWPFNINYTNPYYYQLSNNASFPTNYDPNLPCTNWTASNLMAQLPYPIRSYSNIGTNRYEVQIAGPSTQTFGQTYQVIQFAFDVCTTSNFLYSMRPSSISNTVFQERLDPKSQNTLNNIRNTWNSYYLNSNDVTQKLYQFFEMGPFTGGANIGNFVYNITLTKTDYQGNFISYHGSNYQPTAYIMVQFINNTIQNMSFIGTTPPLGVTMSPVTDTQPIALPGIEGQQYSYYRFTPTAVTGGGSYELGFFGLTNTINLRQTIKSITYGTNLSGTAAYNVSAIMEATFFPPNNALPIVITDTRPLIFKTANTFTPGGYTFISGSNSNTLISSWTLEASYAGNFWVTIDRQTNHFPTFQKTITTLTNTSIPIAGLEV
jgi:hypothetical protein